MRPPLSSLAPDHPSRRKPRSSRKSGDVFDLSPFQGALASIWALFRSRQAALPNVVFTLHTRKLGKRAATYHPATAEIRYNLRAFERPSFAFGELLHEAGHALSIGRGVRDGTGNWHNSEFRKSIELLGGKASTPKDGSIERAHGFSVVTYDPARFERHLALIHALPALNLPPESPKPVSNGGGMLQTASCSCKSPLTIKLSKKVLTSGQVFCRRCNSPFRGGTVR